MTSVSSATGTGTVRGTIKALMRTRLWCQWFCKDECKDTPLEEDKKKRTLARTRCNRTLDRDLHASYNLNILEVAAQYALVLLLVAEMTYVLLVTVPLLPLAVLPLLPRGSALPCGGPLRPRSNRVRRLRV
jgi:hypothetical protein